MKKNLRYFKYFCSIHLFTKLKIMSNRLIHESSPYLQQHAHNPVDWYPWGEEALAKAKQENKPILLSIGYATCHWCHVMERESFENKEVAAFMNEHFINIKVDREERPDIDHIYMEVVQLISGQGGWPLNCFLLPDGRAFFAGTYFPPRESYGRIAWSQVLVNIINAFRKTPEVVQEQAATILHYLNRSTENFVQPLQDLAMQKNNINTNLAEDIFNTLAEDFDTIDGGFGSAPKFPSTHALGYLSTYIAKGGKAKDKAQAHLDLSLEKMALGGIYDQIGGGFARYAVDRAWFAPHFEKMLYDNALLIELYANAYQQKPNSLYKKIVNQTYDWLQREMLAENGAYYAALDADSEGEEGKFYVWTWAELQAALDENTLDWCVKIYNCKPEGNWEEGKNILYLKTTPEQIANQWDWSLEALFEKMQTIEVQLMQIRHQRVRPGLDNKILLDWNALLVPAFTKAYFAFGDIKYKTAALTLIDNLATLFAQKDNKLWHSFSAGKGGKIEAFLDDYAFYIQALLAAYELSFDKKYLQAAQNYADFILAEFWDNNQQLFFFSAAYASGELVLRNKDLYDNATPSGNAIMLKNLQILSLIYPNKKYEVYFEKGVWSMLDSIQKYPLSFAIWAQNALQLIQPWKEVVLIGKEATLAAAQLQTKAPIQTLIMASEMPNDDFELMRNRPAQNGELTIYVCQNNTCAAPVYSVEAALALL